MVTSHSASPSHSAVSKVRRGRAAGAVAIAALWLLCGVAGAADKPRKPAALDDLKPAYATAADIAEGKRVADGLCARCHGVNGISTTKGVPHLAGQRPAYLYSKLQAYQSGARADNGHGERRQVPERRRAGQGRRLLRQPRARATGGGGAATRRPRQPDPVAAGKAAARAAPAATARRASARCPACRASSGSIRSTSSPR